jgi:hypothetical protein
LLERQSISRFSRVLFCSFVLFRFCTSDTGSGIGNGQRGGPSVRRKWTSGRGYAQMPVGLLILRVFLPLLSFSLFLHCRHRSTPSIWPPKGPRATPKELPRVPKSSQELPRPPQLCPGNPEFSPKTSKAHPRSTQEFPTSSLELPMNSQERPRSTQGVPKNPHGASKSS